MSLIRKRDGFTLIELATVLVIIGLILAMAFRGKDLIDSAKVRNMQAQFTKINSALSIYFEKYGTFPGDGCSSTPKEGEVVCENSGRKNGIYDNALEAEAALRILKNAAIVNSSDLKSAFGLEWRIAPVSSEKSGNFQGNVNYLTVGEGIIGSNMVADPRYICALDALMDDGDPAGGVLRSSLRYNGDSDCYSQEIIDQGRHAFGIRLLP